MPESTTHNSIDALLPPEMAERAERVGVEKTRLDTTSLIALAVLAGAFVAFGSMFAVVVTAGAEGLLPYGVIRLSGGLVFSLGLILVIVDGAELFTGNNLMVMAFASGRVGLREILRAWAIVYVGNFVGATGVALLVFLAAGYAHGGGLVGIEALKSADGKASLSALQALIHGALANVLVCLATWLCFSARTTTDKILAIILPIAAFSAAGFEHSIANMYLLTFALLTKYAAPSAFWSTIGQTPSTFLHLDVMGSLINLLWVTIGNMIGGVMVGTTYWFIYLRMRGRHQKDVGASSSVVDGKRS